MRLLINATILNNPELTGLGVYTQNLLSELLPLCEADERVESITMIGDSNRLITLFTSVPSFAQVNIEHCETGNPFVRLWSLSKIARRWSKQSDSLFYSPTHHGVWIGGLRQIVTVHDLLAMLFPANYRMQHYYFKYYLPGVLKLCEQVITVSDNTARDLRRFYPNCPLTATVYEAVKLGFSGISAVAIPDLVGKRFFMFVGPGYIYKNCDRLIDAFAIAHQQPQANDHLLVFVGGRPAYVEYLRQHIQSATPGLAPQIRFFDHVSDAQLVWLFQHATSTMVTTLYEGFGLPALEAMSCGCPVVASNVASLPEVCGDAALMVNPAETSEIAAAMTRLIDDSELRSELVARGERNIRRFSWTKAAQQVYARLTDSPVR